MGFVDVLEMNNSNFILDIRYKNIRKTKFRNKPGVYVFLDKKGKPYYVGHTGNLYSRLKSQVKNKPPKEENPFAIYFTQTKDKAKALEAIFLSLLWGWAKPSKNAVKPKIKPKAQRMKQSIERAMEKKRKEMKKKDDEIFKSSKTKSVSRRSAKNKTRRSKPQDKVFRKTAPRSSAQKRLSLKELFNKGFLKGPQALKKEWRSGKISQAVLLPSGEIEYQGKKYPDPSPPAKTASGWQKANGWNFWRIQDRSKKWIRLKEFAKNSILL